MEENLNQESSFSDAGMQRMMAITSNVEKARHEIRKYVIGQDEMIDLLMVGVLSNGHILLEGVPGIAKTLTAKVFAKTLAVHFARIQFTPDLMPSDIIGTSIYNQKESAFVFRRGPVFSNIVLIDEINRAPAKTQSALFEVMEERQITYDGTTYPMEFPFLVLATQNPIEQEGTYRLPEAQLDRFLFKVKLTYPNLNEEREILARYKDEIKAPELDQIQSVFNASSLREIQDKVKTVKVEDQLIKYIADIIHATREHGKLFLGASPRASLALLKTSKALAAMRGRDFVIPDDVQFLSYHVLNHRIILTPEAEMEGMVTEDVIREIIQKLEVPR
ncbi:MAG: MoxR family ATPase [Flavobacteriales bacterium]|nr:MoxR family ATPase [Flavobacteriales bacterium]